MAGWTQQEIADSVGVPRKTIDDSFGEFGNIANLAKTQQSAADHATDFAHLAVLVKSSQEDSAMQELKKANALLLLDAIELGTATYCLDAELAINGHDRRFEPQPASESTWHMPGSREKIEVLRQRVERGESLWHELDNTSPPKPKDLMNEKRRQRRRMAEVA